MALEQSLIESHQADGRSQSPISSKFDKESYERSLWSWYAPVGKSKPPTPPTSTDGEHGLTTIECWKYNSEKSSIVEIQTTSQDNLSQWLKKPVPLQGTQSPSAGFKIMAVPSAERFLPPGSLAREVISTISKAFGLPPVESHDASREHGVCGMFTQRDKSYVTIFRRTSDLSTITTVLRYHPFTNTTLGYLQMSKNFAAMQKFDMIPTQFLECSHPLLIPLLMYELTFDRIVERLTDGEIALNKIEKQTGLGILKATEAPVDYQILVRTLSKEQSWMLFTTATLLTTKVSVEFIRQKLRYLDEVLPGEHREALKGPTVILNERIEFMLNGMEHARLAHALEKRMESQQTVLFNLIAQADNQVNIGLAKDSKEIAAASKQDSSAMKIIAVLTTLFLPGTFLATFFAMPFFDWSAKSIDDVATPHFWIYWAVTGPVTVATMVGVILWALWHGRQTRLIHLRARESVLPGDAVVKDSDNCNGFQGPGTHNTESYSRHKRTLFSILRRRGPNSVQPEGYGEN